MKKKGFIRVIKEIRLKTRNLKKLVEIPVVQTQNQGLA